MNLRLEMRHRSGILCELEADENGFFNVFIAEGQRLPPEWIVRGALDHYKAFLQTDWIIKERLAGRSIIHDCGGRVFSLPIPERKPRRPNLNPLFLWRLISKKKTFTGLTGRAFGAPSKTCERTRQHERGLPLFRPPVHFQAAMHGADPQPTTSRFQSLSGYDVRMDRSTQGKAHQRISPVDLGRRPDLSRPLEHIDSLRIRNNTEPDRILAGRSR